MTLEFTPRRPWDIDSVARPWGGQPAIYRYLLEHLEGARERGDHADVVLPDEDRQSGTGLRWMAGALDGVFGHHSEGSDPEQTAQTVFAGLRALTEESSDDRAAALYKQLMSSSALQFVDALLSMIAQARNLPLDRLHAVARWLATETPDREPVKVAIAILGMISRGEDREILLTLGKHEEFTLFSVVALLHSEPDSEPLLWQLAQSVTGWGRIHIVERLADTRDDRIKAWLLREGCRNSIMNEYTALICAKTGDLVTVLRTTNPDAPLLKGAGTILDALMGRGGPAEGIESYADGPEATELFLAHIRNRDAELDHLNVVATIGRFVEEERENADESAAGWRQRATRIADHVRAIMGRADWPAKIQSGLSHPDRELFFTATEAARLFGIDTWEVFFERVQRGEDDWFFLMQTDDPIRIDRVVRLAEERLPLEDIATGPADELGMGLEFRAHRSLDFVLSHLDPFPGKGWPLIRAGLQSPVTRNRNIAVRVLAAWEKTNWPPEAELMLRHAMKAEPGEGTRESMRKALAGEPLTF